MEAAEIAEKVVNDLQLGTSASAWLAAKLLRAAAEEEERQAENFYENMASLRELF